MSGRFTIDEDGKYWDRETQRYVTIDYLMDLVNAQHEEIQSLKDQLRNLRRLANELYMEGSE